MISTVTYSDFYDYLRTHRSGARLFYFVKIENYAADLILYYSDCDYVLGSYIPTKISVSPVSYNASLYNGNYAIKEVKVDIQNVDLGDGARFIDAFSSDQFETGFCTIYLGFDGITDTADLFPFYKGNMLNFNYNFLSCEFTVIDRKILDLPAIPKNKFERASYYYIDENFIGKPKPICYGRWRYEYSGSARYGHLALIPGYIIQNAIDTSNEKIVLEFSDLALDVIDKILIYDPDRNAMGEILDSGGTTISTDAANARATINFFTYNARNFLDALFYFYPNRLGTSTATDPEKAFDNIFTTSYADLQTQTLRLNFKSMTPYSSDLLQPFFSDSNGEITVGFGGAIIQISGKRSIAFSSGDTVTINLQNTTYQIVMDYTQVNAAFPSSGLDSFVWDSAALQLCYPYQWDGATICVTIQESDDASGSNTNNYDLIPDAGIYPTMAAMAAELEKQANNAGGDNTYSIRYLPHLNKMRFTIESTGGSFPYIKLIHQTRSDDIGVTANSSGYDNASQDSDSPTILDIPDGDFSLAQLFISVSAAGGKSLYVAGARIRLHRTYRKFEIADQRSISARNKRTWGRRGGSTGGGGAPVRGSGGLHYQQVNFSDQQSISNEIDALKFYATVDGVDDGGASYLKKAPEIIKSILADYIGIAAGDIDSTNFSTANGNRSHEVALYLDNEINAQDVCSILARYGFGFWFAGQDGKYKMAVTKSSYSSGDVSATIYLADIKDPSSQNFKISHSKTEEISQDLFFNYLYNWATGEFNKQIEKVPTATLNLKQSNDFCQYITSDAHASSVAEYFAGTGGTYGQFGNVKTIVELTTLNLDFHFNELGDILKFSTEVDSLITAYGATLSDIYFMVVGKQYSRREIKLTLLEVG